MSGCAPRDEAQPGPGPNQVPAPSAVPERPAPGPLPAPEALADVMARLADPNVPGTEKLGLIEDTAPADAAALDRFAAALRDSGFTPVRFTASEMRWSDSRPGDVIATITAAAPESAATTAVSAGQFAFPMEFRPDGTGWQLSRDTAEMLLAFGNARTEPSAPTR